MEKDFLSKWSLEQAGIATLISDKVTSNQNKADEIKLFKPDSSGSQASL
jgi:hypothetical protein